MKFQYGVFLLMFFFLLSCDQKESSKQQVAQNVVVASATNYGGFGSPEKWGEHLVTVSGCHDCHSPKKVTANGVEFDSSRLLSGHPSEMPPPLADRKFIEKNNYILTNDLTAWLGPWGVSFAANLTADETGTGNWKEEQFMNAIRKGYSKGLPGLRPLLDPMPWKIYRNMTDPELKAIFAYLKTTKPIHNIVPQPIPPVIASARS